MTEELAKYEASPMAEIEREATAIFASKFFSDVSSASQAIVKIMAGREIGIGPFASMNGLHVIQGKPTYGANILAAKVKGSGRYDYRVKEISEKACAIEFLQGGASLGVSTFTIEDAKKSGTKNIDKFPRNMLFARAMSNGIKWFTPDVLGGVTAYVPQEFGAVVDDNNMIVDAAPEPVKLPAPANPDLVYTGPSVDEAFPNEAAYNDACETLTKEGKRYGDVSTDHLTLVAGSSRTPEDKRKAAGIILAWRAAHPQK